MQFGLKAGLSLVQSLPQQIGKEMMIAVPASLVVQWNDKEIGVFEILQGLLAVVLVGVRLGCAEPHRIAQRTVQPIEDRSLQQEVLDAFALLLQDLFD